VLDIQDEIKFNDTDNPTKDILDLTQQCTSLIEAKIKDFPDQWFWFHNRWKNQPEGENHESR
jgi:KDO2-lipid IV(A) lauroyltransferase